MYSRPILQQMGTRPLSSFHMRSLHSLHFSLRAARGLVPGLLVGLALLTAASANAEETAPAESPPSASEAEPEATGAAEMAGREIYEKVLDNRFDAYTQDLVMSSGDRGGNIQDTKMAMKYLSFREMDKRIISKSIMKYHAPQDVRHLGYLVINKVDGSEDQFVYRPSSRRVRRINLRGEAIFGTDFAFEDIIPQELENATYARKPNSELNGIPVYVVEVTPVEEQDSEYSRFDVYVTQDTFVALQVQYWDQDGLHIKELTSDPESITLYEEKTKDDPKKIWVANSQKIRHLKLETWTELTVDNLESSSKLKKKHFSERELARGH